MLILVVYREFYIQIKHINIHQNILHTYNAGKQFLRIRKTIQIYTFYRVHRLNRITNDLNMVNAVKLT